MADQQPQQPSALQQLLSKFMSNLPFLKGLGSPAPPQGGAPPQPGGGVTPPGGQQQPAPPPQDPSYIQGQVNEYMRQQGIQKQQQQLNQQKKDFGSKCDNRQLCNRGSRDYHRRE